MTEQDIAAKWIDEMAEEIDKPDLMFPSDFMPVAKQCALNKAKTMVQYRVPPLQYWENVVTEIEKYPV